MYNFILCTLTIKIFQEQRLLCYTFEFNYRR